MATFHNNHQRLIRAASEHSDYISSLVQQELESKDRKISSLRDEVFSLKEKLSSLREKNRQLRQQGKEERAAIRSLKKQLTRQQRENQALRKKVSLLEKSPAQRNESIDSGRLEGLEKKLARQQKRSSSNSDQAPSSDLFFSRKSRSTGTRGARKGHPLHRSRLSSHPDSIEKRFVRRPPAGAVRMTDEEGNVYYATQEIDMVLDARIHEIRWYPDPAAPEASRKERKLFRINPVVYTDHFRAMVLYLSSVTTIPLGRLCRMLYEFSSGTISLKESTIVRWHEKYWKKSGKPMEKLLREILSSLVVHVDETGMKLEGRPLWFHTLTSDSGTLYMATEKRNGREDGPLSVLEEFEGVLVHDHFRPYQALENCTHSECAVHLARHVFSGADIDGSAGCERFLEVLHDLLERKTDLLEKGIEEFEPGYVDSVQAELEAVARETLEQWQEKGIDRKDYQPDYVPTFRRFLRAPQEYLEWARDFRVPFSNNAAERTLRKVKAKKKASGQFVSMTGARAYASEMSTVETARQRGENILEALESLMKS